MMLRNLYPILLLVFGSFLIPLLSFAQEKIKGSHQQDSSNDKLMIEDYGVRGHLFNIAEDSILEEIMDKLLLAQKDGTLERLQSEFTNRVKERVLHPVPVANITKARKNRSWTYDPTYTQDTTIVDDKGRVIVAAGTTINALDKVKWGEPMIFIDGEDEEQIKWVAKQPGKIVLTNGSPLLAADLLKRAIYFDQGGLLCRRFKIESVPAIIEQEDRLLRIREVKL